MTAPVALVTCSALADLEADDRLLLDALRARGIAAVPAIWDDPAVEWDRFALSVVRSTWDYSARRDAFVRWADGVPRLHNPAGILRWNTDKRYLAELEGAGIATVPTLFVEPDQDIVVGLPVGGLVVKPAISAGARDTERHREIRPAMEHIAALGDAGRTAMVQPYLGGVERRGETALIFADGAFSHAARKGAMLVNGRPDDDEELFYAEQVGPAQPSDEEIELARRVLAAVVERFGAPPLYARVDLVPSFDGEPVVLELELTEPSLFFCHAPGSAARMAAAIAARIA